MQPRGAGEPNRTGAAADIELTKASRSVAHGAFDGLSSELTLSKIRSIATLARLARSGVNPMRSDEARTLQWRQINFQGAGEITVGGSKTEAGRGRRIPLTANLKAVLSQHAEWCSSKLGRVKPDWYVFPLSNRLAVKNPLKPVTSLKTSWESTREKADVKCRLHDLRHTFCTKLAEAGVPESTMLAIMGHMSRAMLERYSHIRVQARRDAIDSLESRQLSAGLPKVSTKVDDLSERESTANH